MLAYRHASVDRLYSEARSWPRVSTPEDLVVFEGLDWEPVIPYYARRTGLMLVEETWPATADGLASDGYRMLLFKRVTGGTAIDLIRSGRWTAVLGR
jgi:hypothetical protein